MEVQLGSVLLGASVTAFGAIVAQLAGQVINHWVSQSREHANKVYAAYSVLAGVLAQEFERTLMTRAMFGYKGPDGIPIDQWMVFWRDLEQKRHQNRIEIFKAATQIQLLDSDKECRDLVHRLTESLVYIPCATPGTNGYIRIENGIEKLHKNLTDLCNRIRERTLTQERLGESWAKYIKNWPSYLDREGRQMAPPHAGETIQRVWEKD